MILHFQPYFRSNRLRPFLSYDEIRNKGDDEYIIDQFELDVYHELHGMFFNDIQWHDALGDDPDLIHERMDRETVNEFLTRVCAMIDVDPAEAIAQNFEFYLPMIEWLRASYHDRVVELYETKLERHYQAICAGIYDRCVDPNLDMDPVRSRMIVPCQVAIANKLQDLFRAIIDSTVWWDPAIHSILDLSDENAAITIANMSMPEEIEDELNRIFLDEELEPENQA